ncbi:restriction endonuclease subunit S [Stenotrophomonas maltophilia]|nr:restriction endonuclease subunit S [Stenotrophomonas maltophilia]
MKPKANSDVASVFPIPSDWTIKSVSELARITTGPFGTLLKAAEYSDLEGVPVISVGEIRNGYLRVTDETPRVPEEVVRRLPKYLLREEDIVFGRKGAVSRSARITKAESGWFLGSDGISIRLLDPSLSRYLAYQFLSDRAQKWLTTNATGTTMATLNQAILKNLCVPLPVCREEQCAIAEALGDADALIESLSLLLSKKRQIKRGVVEELLSGKKRLPGFNGAWVLETIGSAAEVDPENLQGGTSRDFLFNYIALEDVERGVLLSHSEQRFGSAPSRARRRLRLDDVLVGTVRPNLQSHLLFKEKEGEWVGSTGFSVVRSTGRLHPGYLFEHLFAATVNRQIDALLTGSSYPAINSRDVRGLEIPLPSFEEQAAIFDVLSSINEEIASLERRLAKACALKQGMMQVLLTGRTRLVNFASSTEAVVG